jgi:hypothetical protein
MSASVVRTYTLWTYDVWGNARDGFQVNDRFKSGRVSIRCAAKVYNAGKPGEFLAYEPTDLQLSRAAGVKGCEWDGESDGVLYATQKSNGKPVCELVYEAPPKEEE